MLPVPSHSASGRVVDNFALGHRGSVQPCARWARSVARVRCSAAAPAASVQNPASATGPASTSPADAWYNAPLAIPRHVDGVKIAMLEGKGRGIVATRDMAVGDLVMATPSLALVTSPHRQRPSGELVVDQILERRLYGSKWFSVLYDGSVRSSKAQFALAPGGAGPNSDGSAAAGGGGSGDCGPADGAGGSGDAAGDGVDTSPVRQPPEPILASTSTSAPGEGSKVAAAAAAAPKKKGFLASRGAARRGKAQGGAAASQGGGGADGEAAAAAAGQSAPLPDRREQTRLAKIIKFNCFGDDAEDLAACACRGEQPRGHIGLWPEFALLNHSCAPNAVNYVVGDSMVVRACRPIRAGEEVSISYLGRPQLLPFNKRIAILSEDYGFECTCERCVAEQAHYEKVEDCYLELHEAVEERLGPAFVEARARGDAAGVADVQAELQARLRRLYGAFRKTLLAPDVRHFVVASLYDAYDLAMSCAAELGQGEDASSLQACLKAVERVSGGSDLHVLLAVRHADWTAAQHGADSGLARLAREALRRAHVARYGPVSGAMMERLVGLNRELHVTQQGQQGQERP